MAQPEGIEHAPDRRRIDRIAAAEIADDAERVWQQVGAVARLHRVDRLADLGRALRIVDLHHEDADLVAAPRRASAYGVFAAGLGTATAAGGALIGATIEGSIDYVGNTVRMSGTFVPMYGLNNMFGQIPIVGLFLGGGSNEGLIGVTYEVVGTPGQPVLRVNPISAMAPGVLRKIFEFNTGKQNNPVEFPPNN